MRAEDLPRFAVRVEVLDPQGVAVRVEGEVDIDTAGWIGGMVDEALSDGHRDVEMDLRQVGFLDPSGIATLLACRGAVEVRHGTMRTVCTAGPVRDILVLTGVEDSWASRLPHGPEGPDLVGRLRCSGGRG